MSTRQKLLILFTLLSLLMFAGCLEDSGGSDYSGGLDEYTPYTDPEVEQELLVAPSNFSAESIDDSIKLTWTAVDGVDGYCIYRSFDGKPTTMIHTTADQTVTEYTDNSVFLGDTCNYRIQSYRGYLKGNISDAITCLVDIASYTPDAPTVESKIAAIVEWGNISGIDGYRVYRSTTSDGEYTLLGSDIASTETSYADETVEDGNTYYYRITLVDGSTESQRSDYTVASINYNTFKPSLSYASDNETSINIKWNAVAGVTNYRLYRSNVSDGTYAQIGSDLPSATNTYKDSSAVINQRYYYKLSVVKNGTESEQSDYSSGKCNKYGPDIYENDDSYNSANEVSLYSSAFPSTQYHTIDNDDILHFTGDYYLVSNHTTTSRRIRVTFSEIDLNGNYALVVRSGSDTFNITESVLLSNPAPSFTSSSPIPSAIYSSDVWSFNVYTSDYNVVKYKVAIEIVTY